MIQDRTPASGESPWPNEDEKQNASTAFTANEENWQNATPDELRQYLRIAYQVAEEGEATRRAVLDQDTRQRQHIARLQDRIKELEELPRRITDLCGLDLEAILRGEAPRMVSYDLYQRERQRAYAREKYTEQLYGNKALNSTQKIGLDLLLKQIERGKHHDDEGRTRINATTIANTMGMSPSTGDRLVKWCKKQLPDFFDTASHDEPGPNGDDELIPRTYMKVIDDELARTPQLIVPLEIKKAGGDQYTCPFCGTKHGKIRSKTIRTFVCKHCHHEVKIDEKTTEKDLPYSEEDRQKEQEQFAFGRIAHAGYRAAGTLELIDQALDADHTLIVLDIRHHPTSKNTEWTQDAFSKRFGKRYSWLRELGNIKHQERGQIQLADPERGFAKLQDILSEHSVILLCGCEDYETCHRKSVIEQYAQMQFAFDDSFSLQLTNLTDIIKPFTPPVRDGDDNQCLREAAELLLEVAGDAEAHIIMPPIHPSKYLEVKRRLELEDVLDHLRGGEARGALCRRSDGKARGYCWDTDNEDGWEMLKVSAQRLVAAGFQVILEESPAGRGGHLWILFEELVQAELVQAEVFRIAPDLAEVVEYWPSLARANRVRLPGGYYARYGSKVDQEVRAWCKLVSVADGESSRDGVGAAALLLAHQNPASLIPARATVIAAAAAPAPSTQKKVVSPVETRRELTVEDLARQRPLPPVDAAWTEKCGPVEKSTYWFAVTEGYSATWFNRHNTLKEIQSLERNGMALSPNGNERTASTAHWEKDGEERYTDFSLHGQRADGRRDSGDVLEYASKVWKRTKSAILTETTQEIVKVARQNLEASARAGSLPLLWVAELLTPAGWRKYDQMLAQVTQEPQKEAQQEESGDAAGYAIDASGDYVF